MVREIVHLQIGQCGIAMGNAFWTNLAAEHKLARDGKFKGDLTNKDDQLLLEKIDAYFQEAGTKRFVPRCVVCELEPGCGDVSDMKPASAVSRMFKPDNLCYGASGTLNNWAKGHFTEGAELIDEAIDIVRREAECCDFLQGFQLTHSLGGGTGSGFGTLLLLKIRDYYPDRLTTTFSVYPSPKVSDIKVEPYNAILSIDQLIHNSDEAFVIDNEALFNIVHTVLKQKEPKYKDLNWVIGMAMSGITASLRFGGTLNGDLRKMATNLVPFPRLHFLLSAHAPLFASGQHNKVKLTVQELADQMWSPRNFMADVRLEDGKYLAASCGFRAQNIAAQEVDDQIERLQQKMADSFISWTPKKIKSSLICAPPQDVRMSGTLVANTTATKGVFQGLSGQFARLYQRKAFLHWYKGEGMEEVQFQEANQNVTDLISEYQDKQDADAENTNEQGPKVEDDMPQ